MKNIICLVMPLLMLLMGCGIAEDTIKIINIDPYAQIAGASMVYQTTVYTLIELRNFGCFDEEQIEEITELIVYMDQLLDEWYRVLRQGGSIEIYPAAAEEALNLLKEFIKDGQSKMEVT